MTIKWKQVDNHLYVQYNDRYFKSKETYIEGSMIECLPDNDGGIHGYFKVVVYPNSQIVSKETSYKWFYKIDKKEFVKAIIS